MPAPLTQLPPVPEEGAWVPYSTLNLLLSALGGDLDEPEFRTLHADLRDLMLGEEG